MTKEFAVICTPSDQGYYEPDTSELIRLKLASEYGYGLNPATFLTDKVRPPRLRRPPLLTLDRGDLPHALRSGEGAGGTLRIFWWTGGRAGR